MSDQSKSQVNRDDWEAGFIAGYPGKESNPRKSAKEVLEISSKDVDKESWIEGYVAAHEYQYSGRISSPVDREKIAEKVWKESEHAETGLGDFL